ncbi:hypothetical protein M3Y99_01699600 [Aphelenchoides fujianensis]|nr:hypothetical protein M3Y99_01699600 [Aphelenchoides fujianensis]
MRLLFILALLFVCLAVFAEAAGKPHKGSHVKKASKAKRGKSKAHHVAKRRGKGRGRAAVDSADDSADYPDDDEDDDDDDDGYSCYDPCGCFGFGARRHGRHRRNGRGGRGSRSGSRRSRGGNSYGYGAWWAGK